MPGKLAGEKGSLEQEGGKKKKTFLPPKELLLQVGGKKGIPGTQRGKKETGSAEGKAKSTYSPEGNKGGSEGGSNESRKKEGV